jgi:hypothetical protein
MHIVHQSLNSDMNKVPNYLATDAKLAAEQLIRAVEGLLQLVQSESPQTVEVEVAEAPRLKYGHGQLASIHWDRYRINMTKRMYELVGAPKDPWGDMMLPVDPAYFGEPPHKALAHHYLGDRVKVVTRKRQSFEPPAHVERASIADLEATLANLRSELAQRVGNADPKHV